MLIQAMILQYYEHTTTVERILALFNVLLCEAFFSMSVLSEGERKPKDEAKLSTRAQRRDNHRQLVLHAFGAKHHSTEIREKLEKYPLHIQINKCKVL